jgi:hypothetical protein
MALSVTTKCLMTDLEKKPAAKSTAEEERPEPLIESANLKSVTR